MNKKTIMLLGSTGMAAHVIYYHLLGTKKYNIVDVSYRNKLSSNSILLDVKNGGKLTQLIQQARPDYIINCVGVLIKGSADIENTVFVNAYFPHFLQKATAKIATKIIHLSTDCVFSGRDGSYREDSFKDADDIYGRSKALGEITDHGHLTIRTSIIGPELKKNGEGLFHWFMSQHGKVTGYTNAFWSGVTTLELARAIEFHLSNENASGVIHLTNGEIISKYDLLKLIKSIWDVNDIKIVSGKGKDVNKSLAKSLSFNYAVPSYQVMLNELYIWMKNNSGLYSYSI